MGNLIQNTIFGKARYKTNTYIGGIGSTINTPALLAAKLGIVVNRIKLFRNLNNDIECAIIGGNYNLPDTVFSNDTTITYFNDQDGLIILSGYRVFRTATNLKKVNFPNLTTVIDESFLGSGLVELILPKLTSWTGNYCGCRLMPSLKVFKAPLLENLVFNASDEIFQSLPSLRNIVTPNLKKLGRNTTRDAAVWSGTTQLPKIRFTVNSFMQTSNAGSVEGDVLFLINSGGTVSYEYADYAPAPITTLYASKIYNTTVKLNFTEPNSINPIDYYEVYIDNIYTQDLKNEPYYLTGLKENTTYKIELVAVDNFYNKSLISNTLNVTTSNYSSNYYENTDEATAYLTASGLTNPADIESSKHIIFQLINNSFWNEIQSLYLFKGSNVAQHKWNTKNPLDTNDAFRLTFIGTGSYSSLGFQSNGINSYANTYFNPLQLVNKNNFGLTLVSGTSNIPSSTDAVEIGVSSTGNNLTRLALRTSNAASAYTNISISGNLYSRTFQDSKGIFTGSKTSNINTTAFINGVLAGNNVTNNASSNMFNGNIFIGCENNGGLPKLFSNQRIQMAIIHNGLSDSKIMKLHEIIDISESIANRKTW